MPEKKFSNYVKVSGIIATTSLALLYMPAIPALAYAQNPYVFVRSSISSSDSLTVSIISTKPKVIQEMPIKGTINVKITKSQKMMEWN